MNRAVKTNARATRSGGSRSTEFKTKLKSKLIQHLLSVGLPGMLFSIVVVASAIWIFCYKLNYIYSLSPGEAARIAEVSDLGSFITHPHSLLLGLGQAALLKLKFITAENAIRAPLGLMMATSIILISKTLLVLRRPKLEVGIFALLAVFNPFLILSSHRGSNIWVEALFLLSLASCALAYLSQQKPDRAGGSLAFFTLSLSLGLLILQPLGIFMTIPFIAIAAANPEIRSNLERLPRSNTYAGATVFLLLGLIAGALGALDLGYLKYILGLDLIKGISGNLGGAKQNLLTAVGLDELSYALGIRMLWALTLALGGFILLAAKNKFSKRVLVALVAIAAVSFGAAAAGLLGSYSLIVLSLNWAIAAILAASYDKLDGTFPINPYPRATGSLVFIAIVCCIVIFSTRLLFWQTLRI